MAIKSLEELRNLREQNKNRVSLRHGGDHQGKKIEILVGMATCGIAAGARETLGAITGEVERRELDNIRVIPVGCIGYCNMEPIVMVYRPGEEPCAYGKMSKDKVAGMIESHIVNGQPVEELRIDVDFDRV